MNHAKGAASAMTLELSTATHIGRVRRRQGDAFRVVDLPGGAVALVVADGMGGRPAGQVAAQLAVQRVADHLNRNPVDPGNVRREILLAIGVAARSVWSAGELPGQQGMGCTLEVAVVFPDGRAALAHVGDSRQYLIRGGAIRQLTHDHEDQRGAITSWLGSGQEPRRVDQNSLDLGPGHILLVCTDGLFSQLSDNQIRRTLADGEFEVGAQRLVEAAVEAGGHDNVTVVAVRLAKPAEQEVLP